MDRINSGGLVLVGCGKMGSAMLKGWLAAGVRPDAVHVVDPAPSDWLRSTGVHVNDALPSAPAVLVVAVKPQMMAQALPDLRVGAGTLVISVAAGTPLARFQGAFPGAAVVRAMPNTPAAIGRGITALVGDVSAADMALAQQLLAAVGETVHLQSEAQMDAVTGVSGSGPAYVFHLIECLRDAGVAQGLPEGIALQLARATVAGAGALAMDGEAPGQLRQNVTSPNGTTQAGLEVLMPELPDLMRRTVAAAADRSKELSGE